MLSTPLLAIVIALFFNMIQVQAKSVFAHFMVGNTYSYDQSTWEDDMNLAKEAHIDGFALNIGADSYTQTQLDNAYAAATAVGGFSLFISFDYAANSAWTTSDVQSMMARYGGQSPQFQLNSKAVVSTFEGGDSTSTDWGAIGSQFSLVPDWSSNQGDFVSSGKVNNVAGALNWNAWPVYPSLTMDTSDDTTWKNMLGGKAYMMAVSPWFYTNCYGKNWLWSPEDLWYDRWQQVIQFQPEFVEILTWNDYGESHYIGPLRPAGFPTGSERYAGNMPHDGFRELLPYYIDAYKNGNSSSTADITAEKLVYYHKINPSTSGNQGGTTANSAMNGQTTYPPTDASKDYIFVDVLLNSPADVSVTVGSNPSTQLKAMNAGVSHFSVDLQGQTGNVTYTVSRNGQQAFTTTGPAIVEASVSDPVNQMINWNAISGSTTCTTS